MLNDDDVKALAGLQHRLSVVRDRVRGVALRHHTGFYLFGRPGTGKTYTVRRTLKDNGFSHYYQDGHLTPIGLFELLAEHRDRIIILDDIAEILKNPIALQILLAALGRQPGSTNAPRIVKYRRQGRNTSVRFSGGLILISNLELHAAPLLEALKSRINYLCYDPSEDEIAALMRDIASNGWPPARPTITPAEGMDIAAFLIAESKKRNYRLDLRLLVDKAFRDYLQHRNGQAETHWKDLVRATLDEQLISLKHTKAAPKTRQSTKEAEHELIRTIVAEHAERADRVDAWMTLTGKSERAYYRRAAEIGL